MPRAVPCDYIMVVKIKKVFIFHGVFEFVTLFFFCMVVAKNNREKEILSIILINFVLCLYIDSYAVKSDRSDRSC